jgi:uncharacterized protein (TIGR02594 family)
MRIKKPMRIETSVVETVVVPAVIAAAKPRAAKTASIYNGLVLALGISALSVLSGAAVYFGSYEKADAITHNAAAVESMIDAQVAAGRATTENRLPLIATLPVERKTAPSRANTDERAGSRDMETTTGPQSSRVMKNKARRAERHAARAIHADTADVPATATANSLIAEARRYLGTNPTGRATLWCGAFMDMVLRKTGHRGGGNLALGYAKYGKRLAHAEIGSIVVLTRKGGGHVGIVTGFDANGNPIIISGNHNRRVAEAVYPASRVVAYVTPAGDGS